MALVFLCTTVGSRFPIDHVTDKDPTHCLISEASLLTTLSGLLDTFPPQIYQGSEKV